MRAKGLERMGKDEVDGTHSTSEKIGQWIRRSDNEGQQILPSTAAITTRNNAVSVAVVMLTKSQQ